MIQVTNGVSNAGNQEVWDNLLALMLYLDAKYNCEVYIIGHSIVYGNNVWILDFYRFDESREVDDD